MPTYEYRCPSGHLSTRLRPYAERSAPLGCPECGQPTRVIFSVPRVQNLTASGDTLRSWGRDLRVDSGATTLGDKVRRHERERRAMEARTDGL